MIRKFLELNKVALKTAFFGTSIVLTFIILVIFSISYFKGNIPEKDMLIVLLLTTSIVFPVFIVLLAFLGWLREYVIFNRNFGSIPFNQVEKVGFEKTVKKSRWNFQVEYFSGIINEYITDCNSESKYVLFKFYIKTRQFEKADFKEIQKKLKENDGYFYFDSIIRRFRIKSHELKSITELETELIKFTDILKHEKLEPSTIANR